MSTRENNPNPSPPPQSTPTPDIHRDLPATSSRGETRFGGARVVDMPDYERNSRGYMREEENDDYNPWNSWGEGDFRSGDRGSFGLLSGKAKAGHYFGYGLLYAFFGAVIWGTLSVIDNIVGNLILNKSIPSPHDMENLVTMAITGGADTGLLIGLVAGLVHAYNVINIKEKGGISALLPKAFIGCLMMFTTWLLIVPALSSNSFDPTKTEGFSIAAVLSHRDFEPYLDLLKQHAVGTGILIALGILVLLCVSRGAQNKVSGACSWVKESIFGKNQTYQSMRESSRQTISPDDGERQREERILA